MADKNCPYFVLIRYNNSLHDTCRNSLNKSRNIQKNSGDGRVVGYASETHCIEGSWPDRKGLALLQFESVQKAEYWLLSDPDVKQKDWLGVTDIIGMPGKQPFSHSKPLVQLMDIRLTNVEEFHGNYVDKARAHLLKLGAQPGVVFTKTDITKYRGKWEPSFLIVNQYQSMDHFKDTHSSDESKMLQEMRCQTCQVDMVVFQLDFQSRPQYQHSTK